MNGSETVEDLKSLIFESFDELGFGNRCSLLFTEIGNDLKAEERKCRKITKSLNESASILEGVMKDIRAGEMEESEDDAKSIPSVSISDGFDNDDDEIMVVDDDFVAQQRNSYGISGRPPLRTSYGQQQNVSSGQNVNMRNESSQYTRVVGGPVNAGNQQIYHVAGDANQYLSSTAPALCRVMTVLNQPSPRPPELAVGMKLYAKRHDNWSKGALVEIQNKERPFSERKFKIKFDGRGMKVVGSKCIAYTDHPKDNLFVGSRVIALYKDDEHFVHSFYVGIIAEPPSLRNNNRYLVFFDDGYAQYSVASHLHQVCDQSKQVWEDIHPDSQEFIRSYLQQYPERPMVRLYPGQTIKTEWNGNWWVARVQEVDASLVKMYFDSDKRVEWIYRGSTRLEPLYTELANAEASKQMGKGRRRGNINNPKGSRKPFVEYTRCLEDPDPKKQMSYPMTTDPPADVQRPMKAAVAKKSTSKPQGMTVLDPPKQSSVVGGYDDQQNSFGYNNRTDKRLPNNRGNDSTESGAEGPLGAFVEIDRDQFARKESLHKVRMPRSCSTLCLREVNDDPAAYKQKNPLLIPLYYCWERQVTKQRNNLKRGICYRAPCGRVLRSLIELDHYLMETNSKLTIDQFCFDPVLRIDVEYIPVKTFCDIKDLSYGKENVPISCVNGIDRQYPDYVEYSNQRIPAKGVQLCLDEDFLVGCDCTDGCRDRSRCRCIQMTIGATSWSSGGRDEEAGYKFRRLQEPLLTGVFECNSRCRCDSRCHNRVVQHGLTLRLQVFKTDSRGWGLRCLDDIPAGGFICIYAGQLLTDEGANEDGKQYGDEYLAELDYMETVEKTKEGYESDICISEDSSSQSSHYSSVKAEINRDTDSTYSGERRLKRTGTGKRRRRRRKPAAEKTEKMETKDEPTQKLQPLFDGDKDRSAAEQQITKTQDWLDKMPITISDDELENKDAEMEMDVDKPVSSETKAEDNKSEVETKIKEQDATVVENNENKESLVIEKAEEKDTKIVENTEYKGNVVIEKTEEKESTIIENAKEESMVIENVEEKKESMVIENVEEKKESVVIENVEEKKESVVIENVEEKKESVVIENAEEKENMVIEIANEKDNIVIEKSEKKDIEQELKEESKNGEETVAWESKAELDKEFKDSTEDSIGVTVAESDKANHVEKMDEEPSLLMITEPTSLNVDNVDLDNSDDECEEANSNGEQISKSHEAVESVSANDLKRTTRSQTSRFHNLPDPKSQKPVTLPQTKEKANERKNGGKLNEKGFVRTRRLFGEEYSYIMDAKSMGNLGRYLNHSCSPNAFVQSVFVDTHDLRFPWVAFFAFEYIRAGTELTWDYNYGIGSVPGKVLYCYCGSAECRGRLL